jgi:hypothetical protein
MNKAKQDHRHHGGQDQEEGYLRGHYWRKVQQATDADTTPWREGPHY